MKLKLALALALMLIFATLFIAQGSSVEITELSPSSIFYFIANTGYTPGLQIHGSGFSMNPRRNDVVFVPDDPCAPVLTANAIYASHDMLTLYLPVGVQSGTVSVQVGNKASNALPLIIENADPVPPCEPQE